MDTDQLRAEPINVALLLRELRGELAKVLGEAIRLETEVAGTLPCLVADRKGLEAILIGLAANARDAMPAGGVLWVRAAIDFVSAGAPHATLAWRGAYVRLEFADTGMGMTADTLARSADPFFTTKPVGQGIGMGLAMARGFAEQSSGGLLVASTPGQGTTVTLWLPQVPGAEQVCPPLRRVLLVDDDSLVRDVLSEQLVDHGYGVVALSEGSAALAWLDGQAPDLLVSDLAMPGMDGLGLIRAAQARYPGLPAILLTGYAGDGCPVTEDRTYSVLHKPVTGNQLADQAALILGTDAADPQLA